MTKFILSLAGGGVRGAVTSSLLRNLENYLNSKSPGSSIYNTFDIYTGSSTGALIAGCIAYKEYTGKRLCDELYISKVCSRIMNRSCLDSVLDVIQTRPKYNGVGKRGVISDVAGDLKFNDLKKDIMVPVYNITREDPDFIKSWEPNDYNLVDILDATSAAPGYFPSVKYNKKDWAIDGSIVCHNPSLLAYIDTLARFPNEDIRILSVGTGQGYPKRLGKNSRLWGGISWALHGDLFDLLLDAPMEGDNAYLKILAESNGHKFVHIDGFLRNTTMDDTTEENLDSLKEFGDQLWETNKDEIIQLFDERPGPLLRPL